MVLLPRPLVAELVKEAVAEAKKQFKDKKEVTLAGLLKSIEQSIAVHKKKEISKVINATGIVVHTNLGRAPLSDQLFDEIKQTVTGYGNIEFDLTSGKRGKRGEACEKYLALLTGAESATIVNNCAAALFLILNTFSNRKEVVISRSELVQIGGGFRIPDILKKSGAKLHEVGTTNITSHDDYKNAISEKTGLLLKVHQSNFVQRGFVEEVSLADLVTLGEQNNLPVINDLGSGVFVPTKPMLGYYEQTVQDSVRSGADLTCFSGDKMLGGGQAGLIVGKSDYIAKLKKNPIFRTLRVDKIVYSMLEKLLRAYLDNTSKEYIKVWSLLSLPESELYKRGKTILKNLGNPEGLAVVATKAYTGGGSLPDSSIPSIGLVFAPALKANRLMKFFREQPYPIIGRVEEDSFILDLKAVDPEDLDYIEQVIRKALK